MDIKNKINDLIINLSLIDGIGNISILKIINNFKDYSSLLDLYSYNTNDFINELNFSKKNAENLFNSLKNKKILETEKELLLKNNSLAIDIFDEKYPYLLKEIDNYPPIIYLKCKNKQSINLNSIPILACISSRKTNEYGENSINHFIKSLENTNTLIVSGGAIGGDTIAHKAALKNNLKTAAIIGSGINKSYPKSNLKLFDEIVEKDGYIISPFSMNTEPTKGTFPARNSIIAGISHAVLVAQANISSGTLITAKRALDFSREVGAIPGNFYDELSFGCHSLIKDGAHLIQNKDDLFNMLSIPISKNNNFENIKICIINHNNESTSIEKSIIFECKNQSKSLIELSSILNIDNIILQKILFKLLLEKKMKMDIVGKWKSF